MAGKVTLNFLCGTLESQVVIHTFASVGFAVEAASIRDRLWAGMRPFTSSSQTLASIQIGDVSTGYNLAVGQAGTGNVNQLTNQCAYLITKTVSGARNGRMFWPGATEADYSAAGVILGATKTSMDAALSSALSLLTADGVQLQVEDKTGTGHNVTALTVNQLIGTQRRRLRN